MIRIARGEDAAAVAAIYQPFVTGSAVSFEGVAPTAAEMCERIEGLLETHPWLVWEEDGMVHGYAYASPHRARLAYQWSVEVSVYIASSRHRSGIGRRLYQHLFDILRRQGYVNAYAGITLPNVASVGLHEALGFTPVGVYHAVGYKMGAWHDVGWWHLQLQPAPSSPPAPVPFAALR